MLHFQKRRALLSLLAVTCCSVNAQAVDIAVTTSADSGAGSLRQAFTTAAEGDRIVFNIPGVPTITLLSDLPTVSGSISFANLNPSPVTIDRNGNAALSLLGNLVNPTTLVVNTGGAGSADNDILTAASTTVFGNGNVTGNLLVPGTLAPGANANAGTIGTLNVTGNLNLAGAQVRLDVSSAGATSNDLITVTGTTDVTGATLAPNFVGSGFSAGQTFLVLDAVNPLTGTFANGGSAFALPSNPFLQAIQDVSLGTDDFGFLIEDNGNSFTTIASGCNQLSAATLLDELRMGGAPPAAIAALRDASTADATLAINQLSGSIYPSLIGAEINHIQNNLESVRDRASLQFLTRQRAPMLTPWVRGYGVSGHVDKDECQTLGYQQEIGGLELGCGLTSGGITAATFGHLADGKLQTRDVDQRADIDSYRLGGLFEYKARSVYVVAMGGAGLQNYNVRRSLTALAGSSFASGTFDGSSQFGYLELGTNYVGPWTPYMAVHATRVELDSIVEIGDPDFALLNDGGEGDSLRSILGLALQKSVATPVGLATTRLRFGWMHENLDASATIVSKVAHAGTPTGSLVDRSVDPGIDWGFLRTQVDMGVLLGGQFTVAYEGQFNSDSAFNALLGGIRWVF